MKKMREREGGEGEPMHDIKTFMRARSIKLFSFVELSIK